MPGESYARYFVRFARYKSMPKISSSKQSYCTAMAAKDGVRFRFQQYQHDYGLALQKVQPFV